jgi:hypothetical protein
MADVRFPARARFSSSPYHPDWLWNYPASYPKTIGGDFTGVKVAGA